MSNKIVFVNGKSKCGCVMAFSDGGGEYSDVHTIIPCAEHSMPESALTQRIAELERSETQLINERDSAESALNDAYKAVMGHAPEWSNWFSFENAIDEIELVCELWRNQTDDVIQFRQRIEELEAREVTLPAQRFCPGEYVGSVLWAETEIWNKAISACDFAVRAAGIGVKGE
ncbi:hypothetical protein DU775_08025 [Salmonella enterica subsp. enterica serovar Muenster]|nr:hypothetical protein [Salmonella enterica subsp. enterica serovar Muenster]